jgi:hypothetical protein
VPEQIAAEVKAAVGALDGVNEVKVRMEISKPQQQPSPAGAGAAGGQAQSSTAMQKVKFAIAVASGKGGVGKSTVTVNLALAMAAEGYRVGILDADIHGPSQAQMLGVGEGVRPQSSGGNGFLPIQAHGLQAMSMAVDNLRPEPDCLLIDGQWPIGAEIYQQTIVKGDLRSISVSAASIVAKVTRDRIMERYSEDYPEYGFSGHKGYPTQAHARALEEHGWCPIHRRSFKGVSRHNHRYFRPNPEKTASFTGFSGSL